MKSFKILILGAAIAFSLHSCSSTTKKGENRNNNRNNSGNSSMDDSVSIRQNGGARDTSSMDAMNRSRRDTSGIDTLRMQP